MNQKQAMIAGVLAGIAASLCCVGPLILLSLGLGGAWVANLAVLEPARPVLLLLALFFIGLAFRKLYLMAPACAPDTPCAGEVALRKQRFIFWSVTIPLLALLGFPWIAPLFY
jgi:mercuric ion transport protein